MLRLAFVLAMTQTAIAAPSKKCVLDPVPVKPAVAAPPAATCNKPAVAIANAVRARITKRFSREIDNSKVVVGLPCDGLGPTIHEIVIENGNGHGGTLGMWRAVRTGARFDVRGIVFRGSSLVSRQKQIPFELVSGQVVLAKLTTVRAALSAKISEQAPPSSTGLGMRRVSSSHDFHIRIRLVDTDGRVLEKTFTGYDGSQDQEQFLGPLIAEEALAPITSLKGTAGTPTAEDRALFAERFMAAVPKFDEPFYWWVMERYVELARYFGTRAIIPGLVTRLVVTKQDRSKLDARADAVEALAQITGWDARAGGVTVEKAAAAYLRECR